MAAVEEQFARFRCSTVKTTFVEVKTWKSAFLSAVFTIQQIGKGKKTQVVSLHKMNTNVC